MYSSVQPNTKPDAQYAIAIRVLRAQCTNENFDIETEFSRGNATNVRDVLNRGEMCVLCTPSENVIAARPTRKRPKEHAEHRLLYPVGNSPMDKLLKKADKDSCVVFYTYNSPCVKQCIQSTDNILPGLSNWINEQKEAMNVFVFEKIYEKDSKKDMEIYIRKIYAKVPLYRCTSNNTMEWMECKNCVDQNSKVDSFCLPEKK